MTKEEKNAKTGIWAAGNTAGNTDHEQTGESGREPTAKGRSAPTGDGHDLAVEGAPRALFDGSRIDGSREEPSLAFMLGCYDVWSATPEALPPIDCAALLNPNGGAPSVAPAAGSKID